MAEYNGVRVRLEKIPDEKAFLRYRFQNHGMTDRRTTGSRNPGRGYRQLIAQQTQVVSQAVEPVHLCVHKSGSIYTQKEMTELPSAVENESLPGWSIKSALWRAGSHDLSGRLSDSDTEDTNTETRVITQSLNILPHSHTSNVNLNQCVRQQHATVGGAAHTRHPHMHICRTDRQKLLCAGVSMWCIISGSACMTVVWLSLPQLS